MNETKLEAKLEAMRHITVATYASVAKCAHETAHLEPNEQIATYLQIIRELTLMIDDIIIDYELEEHAT